MLEVNNVALETASDMIHDDQYLNESATIAADVDGEQIMESVKDLDVLDFHLPYSEAMVPVFKNGDDYLVEHSDVVKVMRTYEEKGTPMDEEEVLEKICKENNIQMENTYLIIESIDTFEKNIFFTSQKIKREKDPKKKKNLRIKLNKMKQQLAKLRANKNLKMMRKKK